VVWDIDPEGIDKLAQQWQAETGGKLHAYTCDVADRRDVEETAQRVRRDVGPIHILINNAGVVLGKLFLESDPEQIERTIRVNTLGLFWTARAFLPEMVAANQGHLVTVASAAGLVGVRRLSDYCASKWAAIGFAARTAPRRPRRPHHRGLPPLHRYRHV
jgi:all-trans-retinol dehydrogenase (NAD+)